MFDFFNEFTLITINVNLFFDDNDVQFEKNEFKRNIIDLINIKNNTYLIVV